MTRLKIIPALARATAVERERASRGRSEVPGSLEKCESRTMSEVAVDHRECRRAQPFSAIAKHRRVAGAIKAWFASIGFCGLAAVGPAFAQAPEIADELARLMIKQAEADGGRVDMIGLATGPPSWPKACLRPMWREDSFPAIRSLTGKATPATACGLSCWRTTARRTSGSMRSSRASCVGTCRRTRGSVMPWCVAIRRTSRPPRRPGPGRSSSPCPEAAESHCLSCNRGRWAALRSAHPTPYAPGQCARGSGRSWNFTTFCWSCPCRLPCGTAPRVPTWTTARGLPTGASDRRCGRPSTWCR